MRSTPPRGIRRHQHPSKIVSEAFPARLAGLALIAVIIASVAMLCGGVSVKGMLVEGITQGVSEASYGKLVYAFIPYRDSRLSWSMAPPETMSVVAALRDTWVNTFGKQGPSVLLIFSSSEGGRYASVMVLASSVRLVITKVDSTTYRMSLVMDKVVAVTAKSRGADALLSNLTSKMVFKDPLRQYGKPVPSVAFDRMKTFKEVEVPVTLKVDPKTGFYYYDGRFMGSWPFTLTGNGKALLTVLPRSFIADNNLLSKSGAGDYVTAYVLTKPTPAELTDIAGKTRVSMVAEPVSGPDLEVLKGVLPPNAVLTREGGAYVLSVGSSKYVLTGLGLVTYYYNAGGTLVEERLSDTYVTAFHGSVMASTYSFTMLPAPIHECFGSSTQIFMLPLGDSNALKMVLLQVG